MANTRLAVIVVSCLFASLDVAVNAELETVKLAHPSGSSAEVFLFGAHVKSFHTAQDPARDVLFMSNESYLDGVNPIRGGIPVAFPVFGSATGFPSHGFARVTTWNLTQVTQAEAEDSPTVATFTMEASNITREMWPVEFELVYEVKLFTNTLETALHVHNTFTSDISFHALLHNYLWVDDARDQGVTVEGLQGLQYYDKVAKMNKTEGHELISFAAQTDSVYTNAPSTLVVNIKGVNAADRIVTIKKAAFIETGTSQLDLNSDAVVWNPWSERAKTMADFGDDEYINMVCVEPGRVSEKQTLPAGQVYTLQEAITVSDV
ncbi:hypothetical protein BBJ28_00010290 [Nothophytophthora sp. Chile5]|nr:hypothetical protein BBJ28_00010290 [Nothophytophthora sp. Chile5]